MKLTTSRILFALVCAAALFGAFTPADAATGNAALSFSRPTTYTDGSALSTAEITGYAVDCFFTPTAGTAGACPVTGSPLAGGANQAGSVTLTVPASGGQACFKLRTLVGTASSLGGTPACKTFPDTRTPSDPTGVTVTVTLSLNLTSAAPITVALAGPPVVTKTP